MNKDLLKNFVVSNIKDMIMPIVVKIATTDDINSTESINLSIAFFAIKEGSIFRKDKKQKISDIIRVLL